jgi:hypothetical protein
MCGLHQLEAQRDDVLVINVPDGAALTPERATKSASTKPGGGSPKSTKCWDQNPEIPVRSLQSSAVLRPAIAIRMIVMGSRHKRALTVRFA